MWNTSHRAIGCGSRRYRAHGWVVDFTRCDIKKMMPGQISISIEWALSDHVEIFRNGWKFVSGPQISWKLCWSQSSTSKRSLFCLFPNSTKPDIFLKKIPTHTHPPPSTFQPSTLTHRLELKAPKTHLSYSFKNTSSATKSVQEPVPCRIQLSMNALIIMVGNIKLLRFNVFSILIFLFICLCCNFLFVFSEYGSSLSHSILQNTFSLVLPENSTFWIFA